MSLDTQVILDRIDVSDRNVQAYQERVVKRLDHLDERVDELEHQQAVKDGRASVFSTIRSHGYKLFLVVMGAFSAGYFASHMGSKQVEMLLPNKEQVTPEIIQPREPDHEGN